jgi:hypothetical protein
MMHKKFQGGGRSIEQRIREVKKLLQPFLKEYGGPVLVHATPTDKQFKQILKGGKLKVPEKLNDKEHLHIERLLGLYPSIFFSLGFQYSCSYDFKYSMIFGLNLLKKSKYYQKSMGFQCYREAFRYWEEYSPEYIEKLKKKNRSCKDVVDTYYNKAYNGEKRSVFEFWKIEKELIGLIEDYPKKKELVKIFKGILADRYFPYPRSIKRALKDCEKEYAPEIIVKKDVHLLHNKDFLGFYIRGKLPKDILLALKKDYPDKILFDGKKIGKVMDL